MRFGQARYMQRYVEPRWFTFRLSQVSAGAYAEGLLQENRLNNQGESSLLQPHFYWTVHWA